MLDYFIYFYTLNIEILKKPERNSYRRCSMMNKKTFKLSILVVIALVAMLAVSCKANQRPNAIVSSIDEVVTDDSIVQFVGKTYKSDIHKAGGIVPIVYEAEVISESEIIYIEVRYLYPEGKEAYPSEKYSKVSGADGIYKFKYTKTNPVEGNGNVSYTRELTATFGSDNSLTLKWGGDLVVRGDIKLALK